MSAFVFPEAVIERTAERLFLDTTTRGTAAGATRRWLALDDYAHNYWRDRATSLLSAVFHDFHIEVYKGSLIPEEPWREWRLVSPLYPVPDDPT